MLNGAIGRFVWVAGISAAAVFALTLSRVAVAHAPTGAIFTTTDNGDTVNGNIYQQKKDVFLDGGPGPNAPQTAAGLDDGLYVFQVTDPSGMTLLSTDAAECRVVEVDEGVIVARMDWDGDGTAPSDFSPHTSGNDSCHRRNHHEANPDLDYGPPAIVVQLLPYDDTPNPGGVYKAWMTFLEDFVDGCAAFGLNGNEALEAVDCGSPKVVPGNFHGFVPAHTKTDNYKVRERGGPKPPAQLITVVKYCDVLCDGDLDIGTDPCLDDVLITVRASDTTVVCSGTTVGGFFDCAPPDPGTYTVEETLGSDLVVCGASVDGVGWGAVTTVTVEVGEGKLDPLLVEFGNTASDGEIAASKICATTGLPIDGVQIDLSGTDIFGNLVADTAWTAGGAAATFSGLTAGTYTLTEVVPAGLFPIGPTSCEVTLTVDTSLDPVSGKPQCTAGSDSCAFENVAVGDVGARTPGFWCNQSLREAGENPGDNAACYRQLLCSFGTVQNVIDAAFDFWVNLDGAPALFNLDGLDGVTNDESQQILCPQEGDAEHHQCRRQLFALLENVVGQVDGGCAEIGCGVIGVTPDQTIVVNGELSTVGDLLAKLAAEGCTDANGDLVKDVNENTSTVLPECPADVTP